MTTLYALSAQKQQLLNAIASFDLEDMQGSDVIADTLEALDEALEGKVESVLHFRQHLLNEAAALKAEEQRLAERRKLREVKAKRLEEYVDECLNVADLKKLETTLYTVSYRKSTSVEITDAEALPVGFLRTKTTTDPDKTAISKALKAGEVIAGAQLVTKANLQIK
ncbi:siphovirus Gp157 family protein [Exiguobacterium sp. BMC-KP]|uniref:siphovirus Gp157 family protein n=1 Tax=Exiguobacterium sp. BMC-KP TaxID=1684312 RepID=UPI0006AA3391|nr:siphovirus Gp157 family protein [Exiguobacterium sp. BMC-KP]